MDLNNYKDLVADQLTSAEDDARMALADRFFGVSDGMDAAMRVSILMQKGAMARAFLLGDPDPHIVNMITNEANATARTPESVALYYYEEMFLPFMEREADIAVLVFNGRRRLDAATSLEDLNVLSNDIAVQTQAFVSAQYED